jgi:transposase InsO family protein
MAPILFHGLSELGFPVVCVESRQAYQALKSLATHKTDRNDARGLARLARTGFFKPVHVKSLPAHAIRSLIIARKKLVGLRVTLENQIRGLAVVFGVRLPRALTAAFINQALKASEGIAGLSAALRGLAAASRCLGLVPRRYQSGEVDRRRCHEIGGWAAADFLHRLIEAVPYRVHTVLTDNGTHFTTPGNTSSAAPDIKAALNAGEPVWAHAFEYACAQNDPDHRLTKPKHPWTNGQVERMNRTIKDATVKRYFYETHERLRTHLRDFVDAYNFARRLKPLRGLSPYEFIRKAWTSQPHRFKINPLQQMPGLNI